MVSFERNIVLAAVGGLAAGIGIARLLQSYKEKQRQPAHKNVYVLRVGIKLKEGGLETFKQLWADLATHCRLNEPNTLSYELVVNENDPTDVVIYERYVNVEDLTGPHHGSEPFKAFGALTREKYPDLIVSKTRWTGYETNVGYM